MNWYIKCWKESFNFSGRARRKEYWMFFLINSLIGLLFQLIFMFQPRMGIVACLYSLALIPANLAVTFRRLHDTNHSGWNLFFAYVLPAIVILPLLFLMLCGVESEVQGMPIIITALVILGIVFMVLNLRLFYLMVKSGDIGPNNYGEDPIGDPNRKPDCFAGCAIAAGVVILFLIIMAAILLPALRAARENACNIACVSHMKNVGLGLMIYSTKNNDCFPTEANIENLVGVEKVLSCPRDEMGKPYQLLDSARGVNLKELKDAARTPVVICRNHRKYIHVLYADGHVESVLPEEVSLLLKSAEDD